MSVRVKRESEERANSAGGIFYPSGAKGMKTWMFCS